jgi:hypothetical protein
VKSYSEQGFATNCSFHQLIQDYRRWVKCQNRHHSQWTNVVYSHDIGLTIPHLHIYILYILYRTSADWVGTAFFRKGAHPGFSTLDSPCAPWILPAHTWFSLRTMDSPRAPWILPAHPESFRLSRHRIDGRMHSRAGHITATLTLHSTVKISVGLHQYHGGIIEKAPC